MAHTFFVLKQPNVEDRIVVWDTRTLSVGRAPENDLTLEDDEISRKHAMFEKSDTGVPSVGDYHTGLGTFVDGQRVGQSHAIASGSVIAIGKLQMEFLEQEEHPAKLGVKLEYASQLKTAGMLPSGADPNSTMLGVADGLPPADDFVIEHARSEGDDALVIDDDYGFGEIESGELLELDDELFFDDDAPATPAAAPAAQPAPPAAAPPAQPAPTAAAPVAQPARPAAAPVARPAPPAAVPAPARPLPKRAPAPAAAPRTATPVAPPAAPSAPAPATPATAPTPAARPAAPERKAEARPAAAPTERQLPPAAKPPPSAPAVAVVAPDANAQSSPNLDPVARLRRLKTLVDEGLITDDEFQAKRARILDEM